MTRKKKTPLETISIVTGVGLDITAATPITMHEGKKYLRLIKPAQKGYGGKDPIYVDVYAVLEAFGVTCPGIQQAVKKLLCAGMRKKGSKLEDLVGALAALNRAIELQKEREEPTPGFRFHLEEG